jgi:hypothetical protein
LLAEGEGVGIAEVHDPTIRLEHRRNRASAAKHATRAEAVRQGVNVGYSIEQWEDRRLRANRRCERCHRAVEVVSFATQQHEVEDLCERVFSKNPRCAQVNVAQSTPDIEARSSKLGSAPWAHQKADIPAGCQEPAAEIAAYRAGAHYKSSHVMLPRAEANPDRTGGIRALRERDAVLREEVRRAVSLDK